jgi:hypothetical protein
MSLCKTSKKFHEHSWPALYKAYQSSVYFAGIIIGGDFISNSTSRIFNFAILLGIDKYLSSLKGISYQ